MPSLMGLHVIDPKAPDTSSRQLLSFSSVNRVKQLVSVLFVSCFLSFLVLILNTRLTRGRLSIDFRSLLVFFSIYDFILTR